MTTQASTRSQTKSPPRSLIYRFEAQLEVAAVGIVPEGLQMANAFDGRVTDGIMKGARVRGIDPFLLRRDGVGLVDAPKAISLGDTHVYEYVRGYCLPPDGLSIPPLEALLDPGFIWPDVLFPIHGFSFFRAATPDLLYLNRSIAAIEGYANFRTGALAIETRLVEHTGVAAGPPPLRRAS